MKAFTRYISKHFLSFALVIFVLVSLNVVIFGLTFYHTITKDYGAAAPAQILELFDEADVEKSAPDTAIKELRQNQIWAMFLSADGNRLWGVDVPSEIPVHYTVQDVAVFSRGYLNDYPVFVRSFDNGLLVLGYPKDSYTKITSNYYSVEAIQTLPFYVVGILLFDFLFLFGAYYISKRRIARSTDPIISAVEQLADGKAAELSVSGDLSEVAESVSKASQIISRQNQARANWISGVSHDIRTPLSMIMGYAERIADDQTASETIRGEADIVRRQSVKIRELVQDLNLVSKLEYEMQPLHKESVRLAKLLRSYTAELLNSGLPEQYSFELAISPDAEAITFECDPRLISRAINNLAQNSIQHNPEGCSITLSLACAPDEVIISVEDDGIGLSEEKLREMQYTPHYMESTDEKLNLRHGLGLLLVRQIVEAHDGTMEIVSQPQNGCKITLTIPQ